MDSISKVIDSLHHYRDVLDKQRLSDEPSLQYHLFADAVYWSDEFPEHMPWELENAFRVILNHRTTLLLGEEGLFPEVWNVAQECFPNWPGFLADRCTFDATLADRIKRIRRVAASRVNRWFSENSEKVDGKYSN